MSETASVTFLIRENISNDFNMVQYPGSDRTSFGAFVLFRFVLYFCMKYYSLFINIDITQSLLLI